jgi:phosphoribulokinase
MFDLKELIKNKEVIFIDIDNTLFNYTIAHDKALEAVIKRFNYDISIYNRAKINIKKRDLQSNHHKKELYFKNMCEISGRHFSESLDMYEMYHKEFSKNLLVDKSMMELLKHAKGLNIKVLAITNYYVIPQIKKLKAAGFDKLIDYLITSEEFEVEKPNKKLLNRTLELSGNPDKDKIIMFGDSVVDDLSSYDIQSYPYNCSKLLISISGKSGAGKSTLTEIISEVLHAEVIEGDGYHKYERTHPAWNNVTHYNPEANNLVQLGLDIKSIYQDINSIQVPIYNHDNGKFEKPEVLNKDLDTLIIDGLHSLYPEVTGDYVKIKIFIDSVFADTQKIERDIVHRNKTTDEVQQSINKREQDYLKYIEKQKEYANFIISIKNDKCELSISKFICVDFYNKDMINFKNKVLSAKEDYSNYIIETNFNNLFDIIKIIFKNIKNERYI